jgi:hypothetical protein
MKPAYQAVANQDRGRIQNLAGFNDDLAADQCMNTERDRAITWGENFGPRRAVKRQAGQTDPKNLSQRYHRPGETALSGKGIQEQKMESLFLGSKRTYFPTCRR